MLKLRNVLVLGIIFSVILMLTSCTSDNKPSNTTANQTLKINNDNLFWVSSTLLVDEETGVNYIVVSNLSDGGIMITPRYNADGTLYITNKAD